MKKTIKFICAVLLIFLLFFLVKFADFSKEAEVQKREKLIYAMDTIMRVEVYSSDPDITEKAEEEIMRFDKMFDRGDPESEVYKINHSAGTVSASVETAEIISAAQSVSAKSGGAFDITIAPVMDAWGFYSKEYNVPSEDELEVLMKRVDYSGVMLNGCEVTVSEDTELDFGAAAKGYVSDKLVELFRREGADSAIVALGGNVYAMGRKPGGGLWKVAVQDPKNPNSYIGDLEVENKAVVTSGAYQRFFESGGLKYHHIIDPSTGKPADSGLSSVTVVAESGVMSDILSTTLFVLGLDKAAEYWRTYGGFEAIFVDESGDICITAGLENNFKCKYEYDVIR